MTDNINLGDDHKIDNQKPEEPNNTKKQINYKIFVFSFFLIVLLGVISFSINKNIISSSKSITPISKQDNSSISETTQNEPEIQTNEEDTEKVGERLFNFMLTKPAFAQFNSNTQNIIPAAPNSTPKIEELENLQDFIDNGLELTPEQIAALENAGFFITENNYIGTQEWGTDDFADTYVELGGNNNKYYREGDDAIFISSDVALHIYHILIDRSFQKIEEEKFQPMLQSMTESLFLDSINRYNNEENETLKASYKRLAVYYLIPLIVLNASQGNDNEQLDPSDFETYAQYMTAKEEQNKKTSQAKLEFSLTKKEYKGQKLSDEIFELAQSEIELIYEANGVFPSPLFTPYRPYFNNDYSQFKPRSHYTKNKILRSYFIAMMWYGRMGFSLDSPDLTRDAIIITGQINNLSSGENKISDMYNTISTAVEFFVGEIDDLTPYEYSNLIQKFYGSTLNDQEFVDNDKLNDFIKTGIDTLPKPRIVSEAVDLYDNGGERDELLKKLMQFRFMGQRFTPDAYVLNNLTQGVGAPDPETGQNLPSMTTALMPTYVLNNNEKVKTYINEWTINNAPNSDKIIDKKLSELSKEFSAYPEEIWTQNIYWSWLNTYRSLLNGYKQGYPYFMTTDAWQKKNIGTVLGSYTELKHDTLLYAKQSYAERGGGGGDPKEVPPVPKGYVEADYTFWSKISELAKVTVDGLEKQNLMPEVYKNRFNNFVEYSQFFRDIAAKELNNEIISEEEFEKLRKSGYIFRDLTEALPGEILITKDRRAGIIADIHTDAVKGEILYEATGKPFVVYVMIKDKNGARLTRGLVFNHYEFTGPLTERYADEDWQKRVYEEEGNMPAIDAWSQEIMK